MYSTNFHRNKVIYELWEKNLTVEQISSSSNIPRSTVGYYVRKFNRLAAQGKPVVFPDMSQNAGQQDGFTENSSAMSLLRVLILKEVEVGDWETLYHCLNVIKLLKELGFFTGKDWTSLLVVLAENLKLTHEYVKSEIAGAKDS